MNYLCNSVGIDAKIVFAKVKNSPGDELHALNYITIGDKSAYMDTSNLWDFQRGMYYPMMREAAEKKLKFIWESKGNVV